MCMHLMVTICKSSYCIMTKSLWNLFIFTLSKIEEHSEKIDVRWAMRKQTNQLRRLYWKCEKEKGNKFWWTHDLVKYTNLILLEKKQKKVNSTYHKVKCKRMLKNCNHSRHYYHWKNFKNYKVTMKLYKNLLLISPSIWI